MRHSHFSKNNFDRVKKKGKYTFHTESGSDQCTTLIIIINNCLSEIYFLSLSLQSQNLALLKSEHIAKLEEVWDLFRNRDGVVGIATGYGLDDRVRVPVGPRIFSTSSRPALGSTQPPIQCVPGAVSQGAKREGSEADNSSPASAEVKKMWIYTFTPPYTIMAYCLIS
jgi:hypothetical protein